VLDQLRYGALVKEDSHPSLTAAPAASTPHHQSWLITSLGAPTFAAGAVSGCPTRGRKRQRLELFSVGALEIKFDLPLRNLRGFRR
jgi:hypothetical protein